VVLEEHQVALGSSQVVSAITQETIARSVLAKDARRWFRALGRRGYQHAGNEDEKRGVWCSVALPRIPVLEIAKYCGVLTFAKYVKDWLPCPLERLCIASNDVV
jgi:hypothetical protein